MDRPKLARVHQQTLKSILRTLLIHAIKPHIFILQNKTFHSSKFISILNSFLSYLISTNYTSLAI